MKNTLPASLPSYAPLNSSWLCHIAHYRLRSCTEQHPATQRMTFDDARNRATHHVLAALQSDTGLTTTTLSEIIVAISPEGPEADRDLLWRWKRRGAIRYEGERPCLHSAIALTLGRYFHRASRKWCPSMEEHEPLLWCWIEFPGTSARYMGAYPFSDDSVYLHPPTTDCELLQTIPSFQESEVQEFSPESHEQFKPGWYRLPAATLLYSPYMGLAYQQNGSLDPDWMRVDGGVVRFWRGKAVSLADLHRWQSQVARLELLPEQLIPDVVQAARVLSLQLLAYERIPLERQAVPWFAP